MPVVYLDEICFTKHTFPRTALSLRNQHIKVEHKEFYVNFYIAAIVAVSAEKGVVHTRVEYGAIDSDIFCSYLRTLARKMDYKPFALYMDRLNVHKTDDVKEVCANNDILTILNVTGSPELNPIETCFSIVKKKFRKERLNTLAKDDYFCFEDEARKAIKFITPQLVQGCIRRSNALRFIPKD